MPSAPIRSAGNARRMTLAVKHADRPHSSILPRPTRDPMHNKHGPLLPMQAPRRGLWQRVFGGRG